MIARSTAVIGSTTIDQIIRRRSSRFKIGGVTTYAGITYRRHGIKTCVVTNVANRDRELIQRLQKQSIVVCNGQTEHSTCFRNIVDGQRRQHMLQQAASINQSQIIENIENVNFVHLGPLYPSDIEVRAFESIDRRKHFVILDVQGLVRSIKNKIVYPAVSSQLPAALRISRIAKANRQEYQSIIDFFNTDLLELMRQFKINEFIVTDGHRGGFVRTAAGDEIPYPAVRANSEADPTGAGDVFLAAYVIDRFLERRSISDACQYAAELAARQVEGNHIDPEDLYLEDRKRNHFQKGN